VSFHLADKFDRVLWAGRDSRARFDVPDHIQAEVLGEVGPGAMIGDDFASGVWLHLRKPLLIGLFEFLFERGIAAGEIGRVARAHFAEFVRDAFGNPQTVFRIEPVVRISEWVNIAFGAGDLARWNLENSCKAGGIEITLSTNLN